MSKKGRLLLKAKTSSLMDISIQMDGEKMKFNLFEELRIDEKTINREIREQPTYYAFLAVLVVKLAKKTMDLEKEMEKTYAELYLDFKKELDPTTNRAYNNDTVEALITEDEGYQKALTKYQKALTDKNILEACSKAFEQRAHLLQSLNANVRKEKLV